MIEATNVSLEQLWSIVGGGTRFTFDEIVLMASQSFTNSEDLLFIHHDRAYRLTKEELSAYFALHPMPDTPLSKEDENRLLRERIKRLEDEVAMLKVGSHGPRPEPSVDPKKILPDEDIEPIVDSDAPLFESKEVPAVTREPRMTPAEIQKNLISDLKGVKPIKSK